MLSNDIGSVRVTDAERSGEIPELDEDDELTSVFLRTDLPLHAPEDPTMIRLVVEDLALERPIPLTRPRARRASLPPRILTDESCPGVSLGPSRASQPAIEEVARDSDSSRPTLDPSETLFVDPAKVVPVNARDARSPSIPAIAATVAPPAATRPRAHLTVFAVLTAAAALVGVAGGKLVATERAHAADVPYATAQLAAVAALPFAPASEDVPPASPASPSVESLPSVERIETTVVGSIGFATVRAPEATAAAKVVEGAAAAKVAAELPELAEPATKTSKTGPSLEVLDDDQPSIQPPFSGAAASASLSAAGVSSCAVADGPTGVAQVAVTFAPSGKVTVAVVEGAPFAGTAVGGCIAGKLRGASVPPFSGPPVTVRKTFAVE